MTERDRKSETVRVRQIESETGMTGSLNEKQRVRQGQVDYKDTDGE